MIKSEIVHKNRLATDLISDIQASKVIYDSTIFSEEYEIKGFIQEISLIPFGFLLMSNIQV